MTVYFQSLQEAFDRCINVLSMSSKAEDTSVQVSIIELLHARRLLHSHKQNLRGYDANMSCIIHFKHNLGIKTDFS